VGCWYDSDGTFGGNGLSQRVSIVGVVVGHHDLGGQPINQAIGLRAIASLAQL
jgi:hypothetical protein